jgi:hypothetical protein
MRKQPAEPVMSGESELLAVMKRCLFQLENGSSMIDTARLAVDEIARVQRFLSVW